MSYTSGKATADVCDRDYFKKGIAGEQGVDVVMRSRFSAGRVVGFYAPVRFEGEICGVLVGFLNEHTVSNLLRTQLYGYAADTMLLDGNGTVLGRYIDSQTEKIANVRDVTHTIREGQRTKAMEALENRTSCAFRFQGTAGESTGCIVPVEGTDWMVLQLFPSEAVRDMVDAVNRDEQFLMVLLTALLVWFGAQILFVWKKKAALDHARENKDRVTKLLQNVADDYICLIDVNLKTGQEEQFRLYDGEKLTDWAEGNYDYTHCVKRYAQSVVCENDRQRFENAASLQTLEQVLTAQKDFYMEYDAMVGGEKRHLQSKFTRYAEPGREAHILIGILDITGLTREQVRAQTSMDLIVSAASTVYPFILEENLTKNETRTVYNQGIVHAGRMERLTVEELVDSLKTSVEPEDLEKLTPSMGWEAKLAAYGRGERSSYLRLRQWGDDGKIHWMETRHIRALDDPGRASVPIVAVTANAFDEDWQEAKKAGMNGHVAKPVSLQELKRVMAQVSGA